MTTGPEEGTATGRSHLRAAHADREHVIDLLKAAFVQGRLTKDELDARAGQALTARTYAELAALTADIPARPPAARPPRQPARPQNRPKQPHPVRNAAIGSVSCLIFAVLAFWYGVSLGDQNGAGAFRPPSLPRRHGGAGHYRVRDRRRRSSETVPQAATAATGAGRPGPRRAAARQHRP